MARRRKLTDAEVLEIRTLISDAKTKRRAVLQAAKDASIAERKASMKALIGRFKINRKTLEDVKFSRGAYIGDFI